MEQVTLQTPRLILRPLTPEDAEAAFVWLSDPIVNRFMPYNLYTNLDDVRAWLKTAVQTGTSYNFGFVRRKDNLLIGSGDIGADERTPNAWSFGYNIRRDCWNQGYATEAAQAMIDFAYSLGVRSFTATHAVDNPASGRVMEKCGLHFDHMGEYSTFDGSEVFPSKWYRLDLI